MEINIYWITALLVIAYPITVALLLGHTIRINGKDKAILFTGNKDVLPVNLKAQTNYHQSKEETDKWELESKISELEKKIESLQGQMNNNAPRDFVSS